MLEAQPLRHIVYYIPYIEYIVYYTGYIVHYTGYIVHYIEYIIYYTGHSPFGGGVRTQWLTSFSI